MSVASNDPSGGREETSTSPTLSLRQPASKRLRPRGESLRGEATAASNPARARGWSFSRRLRSVSDLHDDAGIGLEQRDAIKKLVLAGDGHVGAAVDAWESGNRTVLQGLLHSGYINSKRAAAVDFEADLVSGLGGGLHVARPSARMPSVGSVGDYFSSHNGHPGDGSSSSTSHGGSHGIHGMHGGMGMGMGGGPEEPVQPMESVLAQSLLSTLPEQLKRQALGLDKLPSNTAVVAALARLQPSTVGTGGSSGGGDTSVLSTGSASGSARASMHADTGTLGRSQTLLSEPGQGSTIKPPVLHSGLAAMAALRHHGASPNLALQSARKLSIGAIPAFQSLKRPRGMSNPFSSAALGFGSFDVGGLPADSSGDFSGMFGSFDAPGNGKLPPAPGHPSSLAIATATITASGSGVGVEGGVGVGGRARLNSLGARFPSFSMGYEGGGGSMSTHTGGNSHLLSSPAFPGLDASLAHHNFHHNHGGGGMPSMSLTGLPPGAARSRLLSDFEMAPPAQHTQHTLGGGGADMMHNHGHGHVSTFDAYTARDRASSFGVGLSFDAGYLPHATGGNNGGTGSGTGTGMDASGNSGGDGGSGLAVSGVGGGDLFARDAHPADSTGSGMSSGIIDDLDGEGGADVRGGNVRASYRLREKAHAKGSNPHGEGEDGGGGDSRTMSSSMGLSASTGLIDLWGDAEEHDGGHHGSGDHGSGLEESGDEMDALGRTQPYATPLPIAAAAATVTATGSGRRPISRVTSGGSGGGASRAASGKSRPSRQAGGGGTPRASASAALKRGYSYVDDEGRGAAVPDPFLPNVSVRTIGSVEVPIVEHLPGHIGAYSVTDRLKRLERFMQKRAARIWHKNIKYEVRKSFADSRLRVKGRFVPKDHEQLLREFMMMI